MRGSRGHDVTSAFTLADSKLRSDELFDSLLPAQAQEEDLTLFLQINVKIEKRTAL